jgi:serine/threonine-protein kinase
MLTIVKQCIDFFAKAEEMGIFHRDIKPENLFLTDDGKVKIGDFGAAKIGEKADTEKTLKGTHSYLSPLKAKALSDPSAKVTEDTGKGDVWSLGVTFLYICTLEKPGGVNVKAGRKKILKIL